MRLLLVEDDKELGQFVLEGLTREGFAIDWAEDGQEAVDLAAERAYDVVVLDVVMPKINGIAVLRTLRARGHRGAVIMATSKGHERDKLDGLNSGADDYIVKPYLISELAARIRAVLRRSTGAAPKMVQGSILKAKNVVMNLIKRDVTRAGVSIPLTKKEFDLLEYFLRQPNQVLSQEVLAQHLNGAQHDSNTNAIEVHVRNLRAKIDGKSGKSLIRNVRGCGYVLEA